MAGWKSSVALPEILLLFPAPTSIDSQLPVAPVFGDPMPSSGFHDHSYTCAIYSPRHIHTKNNNIRGQTLPNPGQDERTKSTLRDRDPGGILEITTPLVTGS